MGNKSTLPVALITGASRGIGAATARLLAKHGYALALAARSQNDLAALADELQQAGTPVLVIPTDLQQPAQIRQLASQTLAHYGQVDVLVNNAGVGGSGASVIQSSDQYINQVLSVNLMAPIELTRQVLPSMLERRRGSVIFIGSVAGRISLPTSVYYSTTKYGLRGFAEGLRREVRHRGVGVTLIAPGFIETAMTKDVRGFPMAQPSVVAEAVYRAIQRRPREIVVPTAYHGLIWMAQTFPGLIDRIARFVARPPKE